MLSVTKYTALRLREKKMLRKGDHDRARLAQSVEHQTFNLRVVGSSSTMGANR